LIFISFERERWPGRSCSYPSLLGTQATTDMKSFTLIFFSLLLLLFSCENRQLVADKPTSDTTKILAKTLEKATSVEFMPSALALKKPSRFGDTILLTAIAVTLELLPTKSGEQVFKVFPKDTIYKVLTDERYRPDVPNYLCISQFEKNDTGYFIQVKSISALPYGGGGSLGLYFKKSGDSLAIVAKASSAIN